jgi:hypothetical protein
MEDKSELKFKYYRVVNEDDKSKNLSPLSLKLHSITGWYSNDYIKPVIKENGNLINMISDESKFKNHYSVSLIVMPFLENNFLQAAESKLDDLVRKYSIETIHFTDIFGPKQILRGKRSNFLQKYVEIVKTIPMSCLSISKNKDKLLHEMGMHDASDEELFFSLFWNCIERIVAVFNSHNIFHIYVEQEYDLNPSKHKDVALKLFEKLYSGINQLYDKFPEKYVSICKHPHFFSKRALLYSSLGDLIAYTSNKIQQKIDVGIPEKKIVKEYAELLKLVRVTFKNYSGLPSRELINMVENAR